MEQSAQTTPTPIPQSSAQVPQTPTPKKNNAMVFIIVGILIGLGVAVAIYFFAVKKTPLTPSKPTTQNTAPPQASQPSSRQLFSGKLEKLDRDLGILIQTAEDKANNMNLKATYYSAGTYINGPYKGYTRYVVLQEARGPGGTQTYIFASQDNKTFVLNSDRPVDIATLKSDDSLIYGMDRRKISKIDTLPSSHPKTLTLDSHFALLRRDFALDQIRTSVKQSDGNTYPSYIQQLSTDFSHDTQLKSSDPQLKLYSAPYQIIDLSNIQPTPAPYTSYLAGTTQIVVVDSTGLAYAYDTSTSPRIAQYTQALDNYNQAIDAYNKLSDKQKSDPNTKYPDYPTYPGLELAKQDITSQSPLYDNYSVALPAACATDANTLVVQNISESDLQKIGTSPHGDIFVLTNKNHPLYKAEYDAKVNYGAGGAPGDDPFKDVNAGKTKPTLSEYIAQNPLLFFKDYWGRWVMLGEYDYKLIGGCGKPVVYLYPEQPTDVSIQFTQPISFDLTIPTYTVGWKVKAYPDGTLSDLQPQFTDCNAIDGTKFGSEYAPTACKTNKYPYLYWAGQSHATNYPTMHQGWVVSRTDLSEFLTKKLDEIGFTAQEKSDFLSYWIPTLLNHTANYYRLSFLQNAEMNQIAPMKVTPTPQSVYRYFLDWEGLDQEINIEPQVLTRISRTGFTLVEWGGLRR